MITRISYIFSLFFLITVFSPVFSDSTLKMEPLQKPHITPPGRGSIAGNLGSLKDLESSLNSASFSYDLKIDVDSSRGPLVYNPIPSWSADNPLTEWGQGWQPRLFIERFNPRSEENFESDWFSSPYGTLIEVTKGVFYPQDLKEKVRIVDEGESLKAFLPDGSVHTYRPLKREEKGIFKWYLVEAVNPQGWLTEFFWEPNDSGRFFLHTVQFGYHRGKDAPYTLEFLYEDIPHDSQIVSYCHGSAQRLDKRVAQVKFSSKNHLRWFYDLHYTQSQTSPSFYLESVEKTYASGEKDPAQSFRYDFLENYLSDASSHLSPRWEEFSHSYGKASLDPKKNTLVDLNLDGILDVELHKLNYDSWSEKSGHKTFPLASEVYKGCASQLGRNNSKRFLIRLFGVSSKLNVLRAFTIPAKTRFIVCSYEGKLIRDFTVDGHFPMDESQKIADVNNDGRPDIIRFFGNGKFRILENTSDGDTPSFGRVFLRDYKKGPFNPKRAYVADINGDGKADIVTLHDRFMSVQFGKGDFDFEENITIYRFYIDAKAESRFGAANFYAEFIDVNLDGFPDLLLHSAGRVYILLNKNNRFDLFKINPLVTHFNRGPVLVGTFDESSRSQIAQMDDDKLRVLPLNRPSTGLLVEVDDGKGNQIKITWGLSPTVEGMAGRLSLPEKLEKTSVGKGVDVSYWVFENPELLFGTQFLLGFKDIFKKTPQGESHWQYSFNQKPSSLLLKNTQRAKGHDYETLLTHSYEDGTFQGIEIPRLIKRDMELSLNNATHPILREAHIFDYDKDSLCPKVLTTRTEKGTLTQNYVYYKANWLEEHLHCLKEKVSTESHHKTGHYDSSLEQVLSYNPLWLVTKSEFYSKGSPMGPIEQADYDDAGRLVSWSHSDGEKSNLQYLDESQLVKNFTSLGKASHILEYDSLTDRPIAFITDYGSMSDYQGFGFDGKEKIKWRKRGSSLESLQDSQPIVTLDYEYGAKNPGYIDETWFSGAKDRVFFTGDGDTLGHAYFKDKHLILEDSIKNTPSEGRVESYRPFQKINPSKPITESQFFQNKVSEEKRTEFGQPVFFEKQVSQTKNQKISFKSSLAEDGIALHVDENEAYHRVTHSDLEDRIIKKTDEEGNAWEYRYDLFGRLVSLKLLSGKAQSMIYRATGELLEVKRDDLGKISFEYGPQSSLLLNETYFDKEDKSLRQKNYDYDSFGRLKTLRFHSKQGSLSHDLHYDDLHQRGFLTYVQGPNYSYRYTYNPDETLKQNTAHFKGHGSIEKAYEYFQDSSYKGHKTSILNADGESLQSWNVEKKLDANGKVTSLDLNGRLLLDVIRDDNGQISHIQSQDGALWTFKRDPITHDIFEIIFEEQAGNQSHSYKYSFALNERDFIEKETFRHNTTRFESRYDYDKRGFLSGAHSQEGISQKNFYSDDSSVLARDTCPKRDWYDFSYKEIGFDDDESEFPKEERYAETQSRYFTYNNDGQRHDDATSYPPFKWDEQGFLTSFREIDFHYGPHGHLEGAYRDGHKLEYLYDYEEQRILKLKDGVLDLAHFDSVFWDGVHAYEVLSLDGLMLGLIKDGEFKPLGFNRLGNTIWDKDGLKLLEPYGERSQSFDEQKVIDFAFKGRDSDLGIIRMGVRDYVPELGRFSTPDFLFLRKPELCIEDPVSCNLHSYARNNPLKYIDPTGKWVETGFDIASVFAGVHSISQWNEKTSAWEKAADILGLGVDITAAAIPLVPGGASLGIKAARAADKAIDTNKKLWQVERYDKVKYSDKYNAKYYRDPKALSESNKRLWWTKDNSKHGGSSWKLYRETDKGLIHYKDVDKYGKYMPDKHKGPTGEKIQWKDLREVHDPKVIKSR